MQTLRLNLSTITFVDKFKADVFVNLHSELKKHNQKPKPKKQKQKTGSTVGTVAPPHSQYIPIYPNIYLQFICIQFFYYCMSITLVE